MRRNALLLIAIGCLVALAGCTGSLPGGADGADGPTEDDLTYPDGVSENGTNVSALADGHAEALNESSFSLAVDSTQNTSMGNQSLEVIAAVSADRENVRANVTGGGQRTTLYLTESQRYTRMATGNDTVYDVSERQSSGMQLVPSSYSGAAYLEQFAVQTGANFTPSGVSEVDGTPVVVLRADGGNISEETPLTSYDATILVDEDGVVRSFDVTAEAEQDGETSTVSFSMNVTDVNDTSVEEPSWLDEARNSSGN